MQGVEFRARWVDGWVGGWVGGWLGGRKAGRERSCLLVVTSDAVEKSLSVELNTFPSDSTC